MFALALEAFDVVLAFATTALEAFEAFGLAALVFDPVVAFTAAALALPDVVLAFASCSTRAAAAAATAHPPRLRAIAAHRCLEPVSKQMAANEGRVDVPVPVGKGGRRERKKARKKCARN